MSDSNQNIWPPADAVEYLHSQEFGELLIELVATLSERYQHMDFSDAVATVFSWFDGRLMREPTFLNAERFPTRGAFRAYLRQAVWNGARLAERKRQRHHRIEALPTDQPIATQELTAEERDCLLDLIDSLESPYNLVFTKCFFEEEALEHVASVYNFSIEEAQQIYEKAIDELRRKLRRTVRPRRIRGG